MKNRLRVFLFSAVAGLCLLAVGWVAPAYAAAQAAAAPATQSAVPTDEQIHKLLTQISEITGMALKHPVPIAV